MLAAIDRLLIILTVAPARLVALMVALEYSRMTQIFIKLFFTLSIMGCTLSHADSLTDLSIYHPKYLNNYLVSPEIILKPDLNPLISTDTLFQLTPKYHWSFSRSFSDDINTQQSTRKLLEGTEYRLHLSNLLSAWGQAISVSYTEFKDRFLFPYDKSIDSVLGDNDENSYLGGMVTAQKDFHLGGKNGWAFGVGTFYGMQYGEGMEVFGLQFSLRAQ